LLSGDGGFSSLGLISGWKVISDSGLGDGSLSSGGSSGFNFIFEI